MNSLALDGFIDLADKLEDYNILSNKSFNIRGDVWCRLMTPLHVALTLIRTVSVQTLRGSAFIFTGIIHLDKKRVHVGFQDFISTIIQAISLPLLGVVTFISPRRGYKIFQTEANKPYHLLKSDYSSECMHLLRKEISTIFIASTGTLSALISLVTDITEHFFSGNLNRAKDALQRFYDNDLNRAHNVMVMSLAV